MLRWLRPLVVFAALAAGVSAAGQLEVTVTNGVCRQAGVRHPGPLPRMP